MSIEVFYINLFASFFMLCIYVSLIAISFKQYKLWDYRPILLVAFGMLLLSISAFLDLITRYSPDNPICLVDISLRLSGICFYVAAFLIFRALLESQPETPWNRLNIYSFLYGGMCLLYVLPAYVWVSFDVTSGIWIILSDTVFFPILNTLTALPALEILLLVLRRLKRVSMGSTAIRSFMMLGAGSLIAFLGSGILFIFPNIIGMTLSNISLAISVAMVIYSLASAPLFLSLSSSVLYRIIIASNADSSIPLASVDWFDRSMTTPELTSAALHGASILLNEITSTNEINEAISRIKLRSREVIIERTDHFTGYLVAENPDKVCHIALKRITRIYEERYGSSGGLPAHIPISQDEFVSDILSVFSFSYQLPE
ncbi:MAG: hypothetical protein GF411_10570 [Candidatus Lokiarchaeota archaeon]|nr:hypothetical protein [Candidatus Lokiarchaeota archaeon]